MTRGTLFSGLAVLAGTVDILLGASGLGAIGVVVGAVAFGIGLGIEQRSD